MKIKELFGDNRIIGLAGSKSSGKSNNLIALIKDFREHNKKTKIIVYGFKPMVMDYLDSHFKNIKEFSSIEHLVNLKDCLIIIDEFQKLKLNDRRYKERLDMFIDFIYHNNNWVIFSSANLREFNSVIGGKIEGWALKTLRYKDLINGCQLKEEVTYYSGRYKTFNDISLPRDKILVMGENEDKLITLKYIKQVDNKKDLVDIFDIPKPNKSSKIVKLKVRKIVEKEVRKRIKESLDGL